MADAPRTEVCTLHRVAPRETHDFGVWGDTRTDPEVLEAYLAARSDWRRMSPEALLGGADGGGRDAFLTTFDDGYRSFRTRALPLLERFEVPCVLFITSGFATGEIVPYEQALSDFFAAPGRRQVPGLGCIDLEDPAARARAYRDMRLLLKPRSPAQRERFIADLLDRADPLPQRATTDAFLDPEEIRQLDRHPLVTLGAHTRRHPQLTGLSCTEAFREVRDAKRAIEGWVGHSVDWFAYPYGSCSLVTRWLVRLVGFRGAFTTRPETIPPAGPLDRMAIPRFDIDALAGPGAPA